MDQLESRLEGVTKSEDSRSSVTELTEQELTEQELALVGGGAFPFIQ